MKKSFLANLASRLRLIRTALTRRFIYDDVVRMAKDYGVHYDDIRADMHPLEFARVVSASVSPSAIPDWSVLDADAVNFTPADFPHQFNSEPSVSRFLGELVLHQPAKTVIELGCFVGWATAHLAQALQAGGDGTIYAVDPSRKYLDTMLGNLQRHGLEKFVKPVQGFSEDKGVLAALPEQADIIFIDSGHNYPQTLREVQLYAPRLAPRGLIVLHDSMSAPGVRKSLLEVKGFRKMTFGTERSNGVTVLLSDSHHPR
jgi:predicted O-methyltransferase YrrM